MRLDKFLREQQVGSRSEVHTLIKKKLVMVNDTVVNKFDFAVHPDQDRVTVAGKLVAYQSDYYYLLNKPAGVLTATHDDNGRTVMDLFSQDDYRDDLFPVGRLDKDTTGLLLITTDGELAHRLTAPKSKVSKTYIASVTGQLSEGELAQLTKGLALKDGSLVQADAVHIVDRGNDSMTVRITVHEGKYHEIKRMFGALGERVTALTRTEFGRLMDTELKPGEYRELTDTEIGQLKQK